MKTNITRRHFLAGSIAAGALAATAGLAGCSQPAASGSDDSGNQSAATTSNDVHSWEIYPGDIDEASVTETIESDVVIIGLGASGTYAAASAIENGLSVAVLERNDTFNANGGSHFVFNSAAQRELGQEVDVELAVKDFLNIANDKVD